MTEAAVVAARALAILLSVSLIALLAFLISTFINVWVGLVIATLNLIGGHIAMWRNHARSRLSAPERAYPEYTRPIIPERVRPLHLHDGIICPSCVRSAYCKHCNECRACGFALDLSPRTEFLN
jgi:hypothetical protein